MPGTPCQSVAVDSAVREYAATLPEPCVRAVVTYYRPDGSAIEKADVDPEWVTGGDVPSTLATAARSR